MIVIYISNDGDLVRKTQLVTRFLHKIDKSIYRPLKDRIIKHPVPHDIIPRCPLMSPLSFTEAETALSELLFYFSHCNVQQ